LRGALGMGEVARLVAERGVERLQMERVGIVDGAADFSLTQEFLEGVAVFNANGVLVVDVFVSLWRERGHDAGDLGEKPLVFGGVRLAGALPIGKMAQLDAEDGGLDFVEAAVPAGLGAAIFFGLAVVAKGTNARGEFGRIGYDHAGVTVGAEIFCGIKTNASGVAERASAAAFVGCADGLGVVFDDGQVAGFGEGEDGVHVCGEAVEMNDDDSARARCDAAFEFGGIEVVRVWADVGENRLGAESADGASSGYEGEGREDDFIAGLNAAGAQGQNQRVGSGSEADAVSNAAELGDFFFQRGALAAQNKLLRGHDALDGGADFRADGGVLGAEIELGNGLKKGIGL